MSVEHYFNSQLDINLIKAAEEADLDQMKLLVQQGADVNSLGQNGMRPLFWTIAKQEKLGFEYLLDLGADPNIGTGETPPNETVIKLAACLRDVGYLEMLLNHGANPNTVSGNANKTPIFYAIHLHNLGGITMLLKNGADINWRDSTGTTPIQESIEAGFFDLALSLYEMGADSAIKDRWGYSAIDTLLKYKDNGVRDRAEEAAYRDLIDKLKNDGRIEKSE